MALCPDDLVGQFVLCQSLSNIPESWSRRTIGSWHLGFHSTLSVLDILGSDSTVIGWLLGYPIDSEAQLVREEVRFSFSPGASDAAEQFETALYTYGGRFAAILVSPQSTRFYVDPCGSLAAVFCREQQTVASTSTLIPYSEASKDNQELIDQVMIPGTDNWYPFGLTSRYGVERVMPNHYLDLNSWEVIRHWPQEEIVTLTDAGAAVSEFVSLVKNNISAIAGHTPCHMELTAGRDTRILLACAREQIKNISFFTFVIPGRQGKIDCPVTAKIVKRFGLNHIFLPLEQASEDEWNEFLYRTGHAVEGRAVHFLRMYNRLDRQRPVLRGVGGEIGRGFHWPQGTTESSPVSASDILVHTGRLSHIWEHKEVETRAQQWLDGLPLANSLTIWGLLYHEQYNGCWMGPKEYGYVNNNMFRIWALCQRRIIEIMLSLPTGYRRDNKLPIDIMKREWPELLRFPMNWHIGMKRVLYAVKWRWKRLQRKLGF